MKIKKAEFWKRVLTWGLLIFLGCRLVPCGGLIEKSVSAYSKVRLLSKIWEKKGVHGA